MKNKITIVTIVALMLFVTSESAFSQITHVGNNQAAGDFAGYDCSGGSPDDVRISNNYANHNIYLGTNPTGTSVNGSAVTRMTIVGCTGCTNDGYAGIGVLAPTARLHVLESVGTITGSTQSGYVDNEDDCSVAATGLQVDVASTTNITGVTGNAQGIVVNVNTSPTTHNVVGGNETGELINVSSLNSNYTTVTGDAKGEEIYVAFQGGTVSQDLYGIVFHDGDANRDIYGVNIEQGEAGRESYGEKIVTGGGDVDETGLYMSGLGTLSYANGGKYCKGIEFGTGWGGIGNTGIVFRTGTAETGDNTGIDMGTGSAGTVNYGLNMFTGAAGTDNYGINMLTGTAGTDNYGIKMATGRATNNNNGINLTVGEAKNSSATGVDIEMPNNASSTATGEKINITGTAGTGALIGEDIEITGKATYANATGLIINAAPTLAILFGFTTGATINAISPGTVAAIGAFATASGGLFSNTGLIGCATSPSFIGGTTGVYGYAPLTGSSTAVYGDLGISCGISCPTSPDYAGYFNGDVLSTTGVFAPSDSTLKDSITSIPSNFSNSSFISILSKLHPWSYTFKQQQHLSMQLPKGRHFGILAQELERTGFGNLVKQAIHPARYDSVGNQTYAADTFKTVNMTEMIPFCIGSINEVAAHQQQIDSIHTIDSLTIQNQQATINNLNDRLTHLESIVANCCNAGGRRADTTGSNSNNAPSQGDQQNTAKSINVELDNAQGIILNQNDPNPFGEHTTITYVIPDDVKEAKIIFFDNLGRILKTVVVSERGAGQLNVFAGNLSSGIYSYSLLADGKLVATKKMLKQD